MDAGLKRNVVPVRLGLPWMGARGGSAQPSHRAPAKTGARCGGGEKCTLDRRAQLPASVLAQGRMRCCGVVSGKGPLFFECKFEAQGGRDARLYRIVSVLPVCSSPYAANGYRCRRRCSELSPAPLRVARDKLAAGPIPAISCVFSSHFTAIPYYRPSTRSARNPYADAGRTAFSPAESARPIASCLFARFMVVFALPERCATSGSGGVTHIVASRSLSDRARSRPLLGL